MCKFIFLIIFRISILLFWRGFCVVVEVVVLKFCFFWFGFVGGFKEFVIILLGNEFDWLCWELECVGVKLVWVFDMLWNVMLSSCFSVFLFDYIYNVNCY